MTDKRIMSQKQYLNAVKKITPKTNERRSLLNAFLVGGFICSIGQFIRFFLMLTLKLQGDELASATSVIMIFLGVLLTGFGVYDRIGKHAGGGSIVPITGFANSVASPAIDSRAEGLVLGVGAKIFTVAGPVLLYGTLSGSIYGVIYWLCGIIPS